MTHIPHGPVSVASFADRMAGNARNEKVALAPTGISVAMVCMMAMREAKELFRDHDHRGHLSGEGRYPGMPG